MAGVNVNPNLAGIWMNETEAYVLDIGGKSTRTLGPTRMTATEAAQRNARMIELRCESRWVREAEFVPAPQVERRFSYSIRRGGTGERLTQNVLGCTCRSPITQEA